MNSASRGTNLGRIVLSLALLGVGSSAMAAECIEAPAGLVGWWTGDNHTRDISSSQNHGFPSAVGFSAGKVNAALDFNGTTSALTVEASPQLTTASLTFAAWIYKRDGEYRPIFTYQTPGDFRGAFFWTGSWNNDPTALYANFRPAPGQEIVIEGSGLAPLNQWTFVAV